MCVCVRTHVCKRHCLNCDEKTCKVEKMLFICCCLVNCYPLACWGCPSHPGQLWPTVHAVCAVVVKTRFPITSCKPILFWDSQRLCGDMHQTMVQVVWWTVNWLSVWHVILTNDWVEWLFLQHASWCWRPGFVLQCTHVVLAAGQQKICCSPACCARHSGRGCNQTVCLCPGSWAIERGAPVVLAAGQQKIRCSSACSAAHWGRELDQTIYQCPGSLKVKRRTCSLSLPSLQAKWSFHLIRRRLCPAAMFSAIKTATKGVPSCKLSVHQHVCIQAGVV